MQKWRNRRDGRERDESANMADARDYHGPEEAARDQPRVVGRAHQADLESGELLDVGAHRNEHVEQAVPHQKDCSSYQERGDGFEEAGHVASLVCAMRDGEATLIRFLPYEWHPPGF